jgi:hypothetical protein
VVQAAKSVVSRQSQARCFRAGGVLRRVDAAGGELRGTAGEHGDPVRLAVEAMHRLAGAAVHRGAERRGGGPGRAGEDGDVGPADLVERDHVRRLRADDVDGGGHRQPRVAARQPAVAQVHLQHAHAVARPVAPRSRRGHHRDEHDAPHEQAAPRPPPALHVK